MLMNLLGVVGFVVLIFGIWLLRAGKAVENDISQGPVTRRVRLFNNWVPVRVWQLWEPNATRPLAYLCTTVGLIFLLLFSLHVYGISII